MSFQMTVYRTRAAAAPVLLVATLAAMPAAHADALSDLRARLQKMTGSDDLKATVQFENWDRDDDDDKPRIVDGKISAQVEQTANGLKIEWDHDVLQQATQEVRKHKVDPEKPTPTREALSALTPYDLQQYFDSADRLLNILQTATLTGDKADTLDGKPVRLLSYTSKPALSVHDRKYIKSIEAGGKLWLDAAGYPVALEDGYTVHGSVMMVISFSGIERDEYHYARIGNRLVTTQHVAENTHSGAGDHGQTRETTTLQFVMPEVAKEP